MAEIVFGQADNYKHFIDKGRSIADETAQGAYSRLTFEDRVALVQSYALLAEACKVNAR